MSALEFVREHRKELVRTVVVYISYLLYAACSVSPGTALLDLQVLAQTSFETISGLIAFRQAGYTLGGILAGVVKRYANLYLTLGFCVISFGGVEILIPLTTNYIFMSCLCFSMGLFQAFVDMFLNTLLISLWKEKSPNFIQLFHLAYAAGGLVCPLIIRPFMLPGENEIGPVKSEVKVGDIHGLIHSPEDVQIHWPFLIIGLSTILVGMCFFVFYEKSGKNESSSHLDKDDSVNRMGPSLVRQYTICSLVAVACAFSFPTWLLIGSFSQSYGVKSSLKLTKQSSALIAPFFWAFFIVSRVTFVGSSFFVSQKYAIVVIVVTLFIGSVLLITSGFLGYPFFLAGIIMVALGNSPLAGLTLSWPSKYFLYSGRQTFLILLVLNISEALHPVICSRLFVLEPDTFLYYVAGLNLWFVVLFALLLLVCRFLCLCEDDKECKTKSKVLVIKRESTCSSIIPVIVSRRPTKPFFSITENCEAE